MHELRQLIRDIPDFPKPGIIFKDITPLLKDAKAFATLIDTFYAQYKGKNIQYVAGIESRGFLIGSAVAYKLNAGLIPIRKKGKLPYKTITASYGLEYGSDTIEMHEDALSKGDRVLLIDDVIATGGTLLASAQMIEKLGATVVDIAVVIELAFLEGKSKLQKYHLNSLISY